MFTDVIPHLHADREGEPEAAEATCWSATTISTCCVPAPPGWPGRASTSRPRRPPARRSAVWPDAERGQHGEGDPQPAGPRTGLVRDDAAEVETRDSRGSRLPGGGSRAGAGPPRRRPRRGRARLQLHRRRAARVAAAPARARAPRRSPSRDAPTTASKSRTTPLDAPTPATVEPGISKADEADLQRLAPACGEVRRWLRPARVGRSDVEQADPRGRVRGAENARQAIARQLRLPRWKASATRIQRASSEAIRSENESSVASAAFTPILDEQRADRR